MKQTTSSISSVAYVPSATTSTTGVRKFSDYFANTNPFANLTDDPDVIKKQVEEAARTVTTGSMMTQIRRVIPQELENQIHDLRERESKLSWDYGNTANAIYQYMVANNLPYTRLEACGYLAAEIDNFRAPNTILRYAMVAEFFCNKKAWGRYDFLPFSHFELAMRMGDRWQEVLDKSVELMAGRFGRPPSRSRLEQIFLPTIEEKQMEQSIPPMVVAGESGAVAVVQSATNVDEVRNLLAQLRSKLSLIQAMHPKSAPLIAQAILLLEQALNQIP